MLSRIQCGSSESQNQLPRGLGGGASAGRWAILGLPPRSAAPRTSSRALPASDTDGWPAEQSPLLPGGEAADSAADRCQDWRAAEAQRLCAGPAAGGQLHPLPALRSIILYINIYICILYCIYIYMIVKHISEP